jgi:hypothetical protein
MPPRPLHYQCAASREIVISEQMDLHLVWERQRIYIKPLPRYLLDHAFWQDCALCKEVDRCPCSVYSEVEKAGILEMRDVSTTDGSCDKRKLYSIAIGFLLSYVALIQYESDFDIAKSSKIIPEDLSWRAWRSLVKQLLDKPELQGQVHKRFIFGELRLGRLNKIYRYRLLETRGYKFTLQTYQEYFLKSFAPIIAVLGTIGIVLNALQLGLATAQLQDNGAFNSASYGFTVFTLVLPLAAVASVISGFVWLFISNTWSTIVYWKQKKLKRSTRGEMT